jgi:hypothetical protein
MPHHVIRNAVHHATRSLSQHFTRWHAQHTARQTAQIFAQNHPHITNAGKRVATEVRDQIRDHLLEEGMKTGLKVVGPAVESAVNTVGACTAVGALGVGIVAYNTVNSIAHPVTSIKETVESLSTPSGESLTWSVGSPECMSLWCMNDY